MALPTYSWLSLCVELYAISDSSYFFHFFFHVYLFFEGGEDELGTGRERGGKRMPSRFCAEGLDLTNHEIMT